MIKWAAECARASDPSQSTSQRRWGIGSRSIYQSTALVVVVLLWRSGVDGGTIDQSWDIGSQSICHIGL
jgi:hypothetical protein